MKIEWKMNIYFEKDVKATWLEICLQKKRKWKIKILF